MAVRWRRGWGWCRWRSRWGRWRGLGDHEADGGVGQDVRAGLARLGDDRPGSIAGGGLVGDLRRQPTGSARLPLACASRKPTSLGTSTFSIVVGGAVDVVARVVATVGREKLGVDAGVALAWVVGGGLSSVRATIPKRTSKAPRPTYQRRHHGPLDDGPLGGGDPQLVGGCGGGPQPSGGPPGDPQPGPCGEAAPFAGGSALGGDGGPQPSGLTQRSGIRPPPC